MGTVIIMPIPTKSIVLLLNKVLSSTLSRLLSSIFPLKTEKLLAIKNGIKKQIIEGITTYSINPAADNLPPIQSMVVVTSPIGDQAPPALAAMTIKDTYHRRSLRLGINF